MLYSRAVPDPSWPAHTDEMRSDPDNHSSEDAPKQEVSRGLTPSNRRLIVLAVMATAVALLTYLIVADDPRPTTDTGAPNQNSAVAEISPTSRAAPVDMVGTTLDGEPLNLADYRGQVVVLNIWGSWCVPCREEAPILSRLSRATTDVAFVGIDVRDNPASARAFEDRYGIDYPSLDDPQGLSLLPLRDVVPTRAVPSTVVLDRQGRVASRIIGLLEESTLRSLIESARAEPVS